MTDNADASHLIDVIEHTTNTHIPFKALKLADEQIQAITTWINLGAPYDGPLNDRASATVPEMQVKESDRQFRSFRPLTRVDIPKVYDTNWCRAPIDFFVRARQKSFQLTPNPTADCQMLVRRAYFDLIGLPPTPEQVDSFVADTDPAAWKKRIDHVLSSLQYGDRWARHWMDVARFAESHGYEQDYDRPHAYHYRHFLIRALNADVPYDTFVRWQLAGDELAPDEPLAMMATGFLGA